MQTISTNKKANHNYLIRQKFEAGLVLTGAEVKSLRDGKANISESYAFDIEGEIFLINAHILPTKNLAITTMIQNAIESFF